MTSACWKKYLRRKTFYSKNCEKTPQYSFFSPAIRSGVFASCEIESTEAPFSKSSLTLLLFPAKAAAYNSRPSLLELSVVSLFSSSPEIKSIPFYWLDYSSFHEKKAHFVHWSKKEFFKPFCLTENPPAFLTEKPPALASWGMVLENVVNNKQITNTMILAIFSLYL